MNSIESPLDDAGNGSGTAYFSSAAHPSPQQNQPVQPQKLELILNPEDGSLQTAPLLSVVTACTDNLYRDIYDMAHGEVQIIGGGGGGAAALEGDNAAGGTANTSAPGGSSEPNANVRRKDKMSNLSFAARRHELSYRLASHSKALTHVAALTASNHIEYPTANLARFVDVSTKALTHARTAWIQNDECQDALYFFHGRLFSLRAGPHDVYGALDFMTTKTSSSQGSSQTKPAVDGSDANDDNDKDNDNTNTNHSGPEEEHNPATAPRSSFWYDLPSDLRLETDRYETSVEKQWSKQEVSDRWQMAVRRKLLLGEVGWMAGRKQPAGSRVPWKISLRGGIVRLMHGKPKTTIDNSTGKTKTLYPLEAILTVLSTDTEGNEPPSNADSENKTTSGDQSNTDEAEWTLISVDVCAQAKTGQSNHQLDTTNKQRYNLHRLCALAMTREEKQIRLRRNTQREEQRQQEEQQSSNTEPQTPPPPMMVAKPLNALFRVAQYFSLSWQLEILSEQAKALSKGNWGNGEGGGIAVPGLSRGNAALVSSAGYSIVVTPVKFFENRTSRILGVLSISFWAIDDRYGPPSMGDLVRLDEDDEEEDDANKPQEINGGNHHHGNSGTENDSVSTVSRYVHSPAVTNRLTLSVRAEQDAGIKVSLSGADSIMEFASNQESGHVRSTISDLMEATSNPFALSASEALLAATILCAERKCYAMVEVLPSVLPSWITLKVEKGSIVVAAKIQYYASAAPSAAAPNEMTGLDATQTSRGAAKPILSSPTPVVLFRLTCDSRTGSFVPTFSGSTSLLRHMACNDVRAASDTTLLRIANLAKHRRRSSSKSVAAGAVFGSGRGVRDAFQSLSRSMNVLGQRTGVGGAWKDHDDRSTLLRQRAIGLACKDVKVSLMSCCGMAVLYGLSPVAIGVATGIQASPEMAGGKLDLLALQKAAAKLGVSDKKTVSSFLLASPPSVLVDQKLVEHASWTSDGERIKRSLAEQERFGICCSVDDDSGLTLYGAEIEVELESPSSTPTRKSFGLVPFVASVSSSLDSNPTDAGGLVEGNPPAKRAKIDTSNRAVPVTKTRDLIDEVEYFATMLAKTIGI